MNAKRWLMMLGGVGVALLIAQWPVTTSAGLNYTVTTTRIPLYEKAINFISRDLQTRRIARHVVMGAVTDDEKLLRCFQWVVEHVRPTPEGFQVVDDHPLHILIRGYGALDQRTEAFILLAGYAGFPGAIVELKPAGMVQGHLVALVRAHGRLLPFDVVSDVVFRNQQGALADVHELLSHPAFIEQAAPGLTLDGVSYRQVVMELAHHTRGFSRTESQKLWPRMMQELRRVMFRETAPARMTGSEGGVIMSDSSVGQ